MFQANIKAEYVHIFWTSVGRLLNSLQMVDGRSQWMFKLTTLTANGQRLTANANFSTVCNRPSVMFKLTPGLKWL
jgi:hypothetical protein